MEETEEYGHKDALSHMLGWAHRNPKMYFKHRDFEEMLKRKGKTSAPVEKKVEKTQKTVGESEFVFLAESEESETSTEGEDFEVRLQTQEVCPKCREEHLMYRCEAFHALAPLERRTFVMERKLCIVCHGKGHGSKDCRKTQLKCCFGCKAHHNSDLYLTVEAYRKMSKRGPKPTNTDNTGEELANLV